MADYTPITDQEIEPEAPLTSLLQHRFRDNPEAMIEGSAGAPRIQTPAYQDLSVTFPKFNTASGSVSVGENVNTIRPGGAYEIGSELYRASGGTTASALVAHAYSTNALVIARGAYIVSETNNWTFYNNYFVLTSFDFVWIFLLKNKVSGEIDGYWQSVYHPSYGQGSFFPHPFPEYDPLTHDIFLINLTKQQHDEIGIAQMPKVGGGFLDPSTYDFAEIDYFTSPRNYFDTLLSLFTIDYGVLPWLTDEFAIMTINPQIGIFDIPKREIPEPPDVTRIGVTTL